MLNNLSIVKMYIYININFKMFTTEFILIGN